MNFMFEKQYYKIYNINVQNENNNTNDDWFFFTLKIRGLLFL